MVDLIEEKGSLALASRLKRLSERLVQDGSKIYQVAGIDFKPTWFPVFLTLLQENPQPMGQIAEKLRVSHVAINSTVKELTERGLVESSSSDTDKRVRLIGLTTAGITLAQEAQKVWPSIHLAIETAIQESSSDVIRSLNSLERALDRQSFLARFKEQWSDGIEIIPFEPQYRTHFYEINAAWIEKHFVMEEPDRRTLENPEQKVLQSGGAIFFARDRISGRIVGTCALIQHGLQFELAKMGVIESERGRGAGQKLGEAIIVHARQMGLKMIFLETNSSLSPAINLYKKLGFVQRPHPAPSEYQRADVYMECIL